jgi:hypothetical protein
MDRVAVFIDAGYLFAQGSILVSGGARAGARPLPRSRTRLDEAAALAFFEGVARACANLPLLRIYWYDGTNAGPTPVHNSLAFRHNVKIRLGIVNSSGEQKGVDSLIVTDLISLSRNRAMADAVLVTGDEDIRVGVQQAQELGVRVHLVGLETATTNQSALLRQEADTLREVTKAEVDTFLSLAPAMPIVPVPVVIAPPAPAVSAAGSGPSPAASGTAAPTSAPVVSGGSYSALNITLVAQTLATALLKSDVERVLKFSPNVPNDIDRQLLFAGRASCGRSLIEQEKRDLRKEFVQVCKTLPP